MQSTPGELALAALCRALDEHVSCAGAWLVGWAHAQLGEHAIVEERGAVHDGGVRGKHVQHEQA